MLSITKTNIGADFAVTGTSSQDRIDTSIERLSTGKRINAAKDDAAGLSISTRLTAEIRGLNQATRNAADAQGLLDTAEASIKESSSLFLRVRELAVQSANGTTSAEDRAALDNEVQILLKENDRIASRTSWAGVKLLDGTFSNRKMMIGNGTSASDQLSISISGTSSNNLGIGEARYTKNGTNATSSHPGQNNSNDVTIHGLRPGTNIENYIQLNPDTTNGMNANLSTTTIDNTLDTRTKVEILGVEYMLDPGTTEEKNTQLSQYLTADGISNSIGTDGSGLQIVLVNSSTLSDYAAAYGSDTFEIHANPLDNSDGKSNDAVWSNDSPTFNSNYSVPALVSGYTKPDVRTLRSSLIGQVTTPEKIGAEFQVNTYTNGNQNSSPIPAQSVTALSNGDFVVAWDSDGQDGSGKGAFAQIFSSDGIKKGPEFQVNTGTQNNQEHPTVTALDDGGFIIAFMSYGQDGESSNYTNSYAQRYDASGATVGSQFILHDNSDQYQHMPVVTALDNGKFVATWQAQYTNQYKIYSRIFDSNNAPTGIEFMVNTSTSGMQHHADTVKLKNGDFVVAWVDTGQQSTGIYGQKFDSTGNQLGGEFQVNSYTVSDQQEPAVTALEDGGFVVSWQSNGQDGDGYGIFGQRYDASGNTVGSEFQVNTTTSNSQEFSTGVGLSDGGFLIAWTSNMQDGSGYGVFGQRFDQSGNSIGNEFQINTYTTNDQDRISLAQLANGNVIATWDSEGQDGSGDGVFAQIIDVGATSSIDIRTTSGSIAALTTIDNALNTLNSYRASLGSLSNRLDNIMAVNMKTSISLSKANGLIEDANYAQETADLSKGQILQQASIKMQVLRNRSGDNILELLSGNSFLY